MNSMQPDIERSQIKLFQQISGNLERASLRAGRDDTTGESIHPSIQTQVLIRYEATISSILLSEVSPYLHYPKLNKEVLRHNQISGLDLRQSDLSGMFRSCTPPASLPAVQPPNLRLQRRPSSSGNLQARHGKDRNPTKQSTETIFHRHKPSCNVCCFKCM